MQSEAAKNAELRKRMTIVEASLTTLRRGHLFSVVHLHFCTGIDNGTSVLTSLSN